MKEKSLLSLLGRSAHVLDLKLAAFLGSDRDSVINKLIESNDIDDYRVRVKSRYINLVRLYESETGEDLSALLRERITKVLDSVVDDALSINQVKEKSIDEKLRAFYQHVPGADVNTSLQLIRFSLNRKIVLRHVRDDDWLDSAVSSKISSALSINPSWLIGVSEHEPCSFFLRTTGQISDLLKTGDEYRSGKILDSKLYLLKVVDSDQFIAIQVANVVSELASPVIVRSIGKLTAADIKTLAVKASALHVPILIGKPSYENFDRYRTGYDGISVLFKGASIAPYSEDRLMGEFS